MSDTQVAPRVEEKLSRVGKGSIRGYFHRGSDKAQVVVGVGFLLAL